MRRATERRGKRAPNECRDQVEAPPAADLPTKISKRSQIVHQERTSVNFIPRMIPSHGRTNTFTAVAKNRLKFAGVNAVYNQAASQRHHHSVSIFYEIIPDSHSPTSPPTRPRIAFSRRLDIPLQSKSPRPVRMKCLCKHQPARVAVEVERVD